MKISYPWITVLENLSKCSRLAPQPDLTPWFSRIVKFIFMNCEKKFRQFWQPTVALVVVPRNQL